MEGGLEENLVTAVQEIVLVPDSIGTIEQKEEDSSNSTEKVSLPSPTVHPYQSLVPYLQRVAWAKLYKLES